MMSDEKLHEVLRSLHEAEERLSVLYYYLGEIDEVGARLIVDDVSSSVGVARFDLQQLIESPTPRSAEHEALLDAVSEAIGLLAKDMPHAAGELLSQHLMDLSGAAVAEGKP